MTDAKDRSETDTAGGSAGQRHQTPAERLLSQRIGGTDGRGRVIGSPQQQPSAGAAEGERWEKRNVGVWWEVYVVGTNRRIALCSEEADAGAILAAHAQAQRVRELEAALAGLRGYMDFVDMVGTRGVPGNGSARAWAKRRKEDAKEQADFEAAIAAADALLATPEAGS